MAQRLCSRTPTSRGARAAGSYAGAASARPRGRRRRPRRSPRHRSDSARARCCPGWHVNTPRRTLYVIKNTVYDIVLVHATMRTATRKYLFSVLGSWDKKPPWPAPAPCHSAGIFRPLPGSRHFKRARVAPRTRARISEKSRRLLISDKSWNAPRARAPRAKAAPQLKICNFVCVAVHADVSVERCGHPPVHTQVVYISHHMMPT